MPIEDRNVEPGTVLVATYKGSDRTCEVIKTDDGLRYRLDDGTVHKSPSSAGKAVMGHACNGWAFFSLAGTERPKREPKAKADRPKKEPAAKKPAKTKAAPKGKARKAVAGGAKSTGKREAKHKALRAASNGESFGCGVCSETFPTQKKAVAHALTHTA